MNELKLRLLAAWYALARREFFIVVRNHDGGEYEVIGTFSDEEEQELLNLQLTDKTNVT